MKNSSYPSTTTDSLSSPMIAKNQSDWKTLRSDPKKALNSEFDKIIDEFDILIEKLRIKYPSLPENQIINLGASLYQSNILRNEQDLYVRNMIDDVKINCFSTSEV